MEKRTESEVKPKFVSPRPLFNKSVELHGTPPSYSEGSFSVYVFVLYVHVSNTTLFRRDLYIVYIYCQDVYSRLISFWPLCFGGLCYYACLYVSYYGERTGTWHFLFLGEGVLRNYIIYSQKQSAGTLLLRENDIMCALSASS
jgi:hypothetical protein